MPLCDCSIILQVAQKMMVDSGYTVLQSDPEMGLHGITITRKDLLTEEEKRVSQPHNKGVDYALFQ